MKFRKTIATLGLLAVTATTAACAATADTTDTTTTTSSTTTDTGRSGDGGGDMRGGPGASVDASSVTSEEELVALIQEAYGDAGLGLHRGHQPVQSVLDEVLTISHDELHVRMEEQGQNLAAIAEDLDIDPQTLIEALVDSWSPAIDTLLENGTITEAQADEYEAALEDAFTFRVTWDGSEETPTFSGLDA